MVSEVDHPPSSSTAHHAIDDELFALLQPCLGDPTGHALGELVQAHPEHADALRALHADYQLARSLVGGHRRDRHQALDDLRTVAVDSRAYEDLGLVARGGMAEVWRIRDRRLGRTLIKKVLPVSLDGAELDVRLVRRLARFLDEARTMSGLQHPAILTVVDFGVDAKGRPFLVMPEVEGRTLVEVLAELRGQHAATAAAIRLVQTLLPACEAIAHAHASGVVHRDLKPSNVMVGRFGEVRVMDWGLAKRVGEAEAPAPEGDAELPASWTRTGDQVGTPAYMAPEQARGDRDAVGPHTDQYALGAILYEGLTGHRPYADQLTETTSTAVLAAIRSAVPTPIQRLAPAVPAELAAIVAKAMARVPEARYPSVSAVVDDLRAFLETRVVAAYGSGPWQTLRKWMARNRGVTFGAAGVIVVLVAALTAMNLLQDAHRTRLRTTNVALDAARREAVDNLESLEASLYRQQLASAARAY